MRGDGHARGATAILPQSVTSPRRRVALPLKPTGRTLQTVHEIRLLCHRTLGLTHNTEAAIRADLAGLTANPTRENAPINLTAASAAALHTALTDARMPANQHDQTERAARAAGATMRAKIRVQLRKDKITVWKHSSF
jgi:hypothetical protein